LVSPSFSSFGFQDLEARISEQNTVFSELERRAEIYKREAESARKWTSSILSLKVLLKKFSQYQTLIFYFC